MALVRSLLLVLAFRAAFVFVVESPCRSSILPCQGLMLGRCAWPEPSARQASARLARLAREIGATPAFRSLVVLAAPSDPVLVSVPTASRLDGYLHRAVAHPRC